VWCTHTVFLLQDKLKAKLSEKQEKKYGKMRAGYNISSDICGGGIKVTMESRTRVRCEHGHVLNTIISTSRTRINNMIVTVEPAAYE